MAKKAFEESMKELEQVVSELERSDLTLDEAIDKFEVGMKLTKECNEYLDKAEKRINMIVNGEEKTFVANNE